MVDKKEKEKQEEQVEDQVKSIKEKVNEAIDMDKVMEFVSKNKVEFDYNGEKYIVRKPTSKERQEVNELRIQKHCSLLKEKNEKGNFKYLSEKDLIELYKERGLNIDEMDKLFRHYKNKEKKLMMKLGEEIKNKTPKKDLEIYRNEIKELRQKLQDISIRRSQLLEISIEQQINIFVYSYFTSIITEKQEGDKWVRVWNSYDEYVNEEDETLQNKAASNSVLVVSSIG